MASSNPIKHTDIAEEGFITDHVLKELLAFENEIPIVITAIQNLAKESKKAMDSMGGSPETLADLKAQKIEIDKVNQQYLLNEKIKQQVAATELKLSQVNKARIAETKAQLDLDTKKEKQYNTEIKQTRDVSSAYKQLSIEFGIAAQKAKDLAAANGINNKSAIAAAEHANVLNNKLKAIDASMGIHNREVGNYTEGVTKAFQGTGILGEVLEKVKGVFEKSDAIVKLYTSSIEKMKEWMESSKIVTEESKIVQEANTAATEANTAAIKLQMIAEKDAIIVEEALIIKEKEDSAQLAINTAKTEANAAAKKGWAGVAIAAIIGIGAAIFKTKTATKEGADGWDRWKESAEAWGKSLLNFNADSAEILEFTKEEIKEQQKLRDLRISMIAPLSELRKEAALAREDFMSDKKTNVEKIAAIDLFIAKTTGAANIQKMLAEKDLEIKKAAFEFEKKNPQGDFIKKRTEFEEAQKTLNEVEENRANEDRKMKKHRETIEEKDAADRVKMFQDAQKLEIESRDTFSKEKVTHINLQLKKELDLNKLDTEQKLKNLKDEQAMFGGSQENFERELTAITISGKAKERDLKRKANQELIAIEVEYENNIKAMYIEFVSFNKKIDAEILKSRNDNSKVERENDIAKGDFKLKLQQEILTDIENQSEEDVKNKKRKFSLTLKDVQQNFDAIEKLTQQHHLKVATDIESNAIDAGNLREQKKQDEIAEIAKKHELIRGKQSKDANPAVDEELERQEIQKVKDKYNQIEVTEGLKKNGQLEKNDEDYINKQIAIEKQKDDLRKKNLEDIKRDNKKQIDEVFKTTEQITSGIEQGLNKRAEIQQLADQKTIDMDNNLASIQATIAAGGRNNSLAASQAAADKAEEKKLQDAKKAAKVQQTMAVIDAFQKSLQSGLTKNEPFMQAFAEAIGSSGLVSAVFAKFIGGFAAGVEGIDGTGTETSDSNLAMLSKGESVVTAKGTKENKGLVTAMNDGVVSDYFKNIYIPNYNSTNTGINTIVEVKHDEKLAEMFDKRISQLQKSFDNRPVQQNNLGRLGEWTEEIKQDSMNMIIHHKNNSMQPSLRLRG